MAVDASGWLTWAQRYPGPLAKQYSTPNAVQGYIPHSMVGYYAGWLSRLDDMSRLPNGRFTPNAAASVHGSVLYDGTVIQHYPLTTSCWASGSRSANTRFVAFETEGGPPGNVSEPLTQAQFDAHVRIIREIAAWRGWQPRRPGGTGDTTATLYEHGEMTRFGAAATSCPSDRIDWPAILAALAEEDDLSAEQYQELKALIERNTEDTRGLLAAVGKLARDNHAVNKLQQAYLNQLAESWRIPAPADVAARLSEAEQDIAEIDERLESAARELGGG